MRREASFLSSPSLNMTFSLYTLNEKFLILLGNNNWIKLDKFVKYRFYSLFAVETFVQKIIIANTESKIQ